MLLTASLLVGCATQSPAATTGPQIEHVALNVRDVEASSAFYSDVLGLERVADPFHDGKHAFFRAGNAQLHLVAASAPVQAPSDAFHFALRVSRFDDLLSQLDRRKVRYQDADDVPHSVTRRPDGVRQIYLQDLDGYWVEINDAHP